MPERGSIHGRVRSAERGLAGGVVAWRVSRHGRLEMQATARSSKGGTFHLRALPYGEYVLVAHPGDEDDAPQFAPSTFPADALVGGERLTVAETDVSDILIQVTEGATISGTVNAGGLPMDDARVSLVGPWRTVLRAFLSTSVDREGRWMLSHVPPGQWSVLATPEDAARMWAPTPLGGAADGPLLLNLGPGAHERVSISLDPGGDIRGSVVLPAGVELGWNSVSLEQRRKTPPWSDPVEASHTGGTLAWELIYRQPLEEVAADGTFTIGGLPSGSYRLQINARTSDGQGLWSPYYPDAVSASAAERIEVGVGEVRDLPQPLRLELLDEERVDDDAWPSVRIVGDPVIGRTLEAEISGADPRSEIDMSWDRGAEWIEDDGTGRFTLTDVDDGCIVSVHVVFSRRGGPTSFGHDWLRYPVSRAEPVEVEHPRLAAASALALDSMPSLAALLLWVEDHAPATYARLHGGAAQQSIDDAERALGTTFPADLRALLATIGGEEAGADGIIPQAPFLDLDAVLEGSGLHAAYADPAASALIVPFAGVDGNDFAVRIRRARTDVVFADPVEGVGEMRWPDLEAFFGGLLAALESGGTVDAFAFRIVDGAIEWHVADVD